MTKNGKFQVDMIPSFCNAWPEIEIEINGQVLWHNFVDCVQTVSLEFDLAPTNHVYVRYLNKRNGPEIYDTVIDEAGNIVQDQKCELDNFIIGQCRCDFLKHDLEYHCIDGTVQTNAWGFLSYQGSYHIQFPDNVYDWVIDRRKKYLLTPKKQTSSLDYWTNYLGDASDPHTQELLDEIASILEKINDQNISN